MRLAQLLWLALAPALLAQAPARITIDPAQRFQYIDGFGVNFNGTYFRDAQKPMIDMLIDDLGATIFRLDPYGLTNWEAVNDNDDPNTMNWEYYNDRYSAAAVRGIMGGSAVSQRARHPAVSDAERSAAGVDDGYQGPAHT